MKKFILISVAALIFSFLFFTSIPSVLAANSGIPSKVEVPTAKDLGIQPSPVESATDITDVVIFATKAWYTSFFILAIIFILVAAFKYLTAVGQPEKIKTAHTMLIWAIVAIAVALLSVAAAQIMQTFLKPGGGGGAGGTNIPQIEVSPGYKYSPPGQI